jgi:hypothetical protein
MPQKGACERKEIGKRLRGKRKKKSISMRCGCILKPPTRSRTRTKNFREIMFEVSSRDVLISLAPDKNDRLAGSGYANLAKSRHPNLWDQKSLYPTNQKKTILSAEKFW